MNVPALLFGGLAGFALIALVWFTAETILLATGGQPITWYVRNYTSWHPGIVVLVAALLGFALGAALAHFVWDVESVRLTLVRR